MIQIELYVDGIDEPEQLFANLFGFAPIVRKIGFCHLRHPDGYDFMLFDPRKNQDGESHWPPPELGLAGSGIEIVMFTADIAEKHRSIQRLGYICSELSAKPWGSTEFTFRLKEGYLLRIKQPHSL